MQPSTPGLRELQPQGSERHNMIDTAQIRKQLACGGYVDIALWKPKHFAFRSYVERFMKKHGTTLLPTPSSIMDTIQFIIPGCCEWVRNVPFPGAPFTPEYHEMMLTLILMDEQAYSAENGESKQEDIYTRTKDRYIEYTVKLKMKL
jgi:hypothetical protein